MVCFFIRYLVHWYKSFSFREYLDYTFPFQPSIFSLITSYASGCLSPAYNANQPLMTSCVESYHQITGQEQHKRVSEANMLWNKKQDLCRCLGIHALSSVIMKDSSYAVVLESAVNNGVMPCAGGILITLGWENVYETSRISWPASSTLQTWGKYVREEAFSDPISDKVCIFRVHVSLMNMIKV